MDAFEFICTYQDLVSAIDEICDPKFKPAIYEMRGTDPHDLISPDVWFPNYRDALGFVFLKFRASCKKLELL